jgi:hypothetical protein
MSWWDIGKGDNVIGDQAADILGKALEKIANERVKTGQQKPTLQELLDNFMAVIQNGTLKFIAGMDNLMIQQITIELASGKKVTTGTTNLTENKLYAEFCDTLNQIVIAYENRWQRKPKLQELLACMQFVLSFQPSNYLVDAENLVIKDIFAQSVENLG